MNELNDEEIWTNEDRILLQKFYKEMGTAVVIIVFALAFIIGLILRQS